MKTRMMIENPNDVQLTLKVTMSVREWDEIRTQMDTNLNTGWSLHKAITDAFVQIRKIVHVNENEE